MNNAERNIKTWEKIKGTGQKRYILFGGLWWGIFVWIITGFFKKSNLNTFSEIFFSKVAGLQLLIYIIGGFLCYTSLWYFHKYLNKKAISKQEETQND